MGARLCSIARRMKKRYVVNLTLLRGVAGPQRGSDVAPASVVLPASAVTDRASGQPSRDSAGKGETHGGEGVGEVSFRPRGRSNGFDLSVWPRGKNAAHVPKRGTHSS